MVLNVNGHEKTGMATPYIQERCINLAKRGLLALNPEWLGRGQLLGEKGLDHYRMNQLDLCGTSGLGVFHLAVRRALDVALANPDLIIVTPEGDRFASTGWRAAAGRSIVTRTSVDDAMAEAARASTLALAGRNELESVRARAQSARLEARRTADDVTKCEARAAALVRDVERVNGEIGRAHV